MTLTCPVGYYFDRRTKECRNCAYVCGDEYGGREQLECTDTCPGYGISTMVAPANESGLLLWILLIVVALVIVVITAIIVLAVKRKCCWKRTTKLFVTEETNAGLVGPTAICVATEGQQQKNYDRGDQGRPQRFCWS